MTRLLLVSCSESKDHTLRPLPTIDRYLGTTFKVIKKARREGHWPKNVQLYIISAKYGLLSEYDLIEYYEQKMTKGRAVELNVEVSSALDNLLENRRFEEIFVNLGQTYMLSITASEEVKRYRQSGLLKVAYGGIGMRLKQTKTWIMER